MSLFIETSIDFTPNILYPYISMHRRSTKLLFLVLILLIIWWIAEYQFTYFKALSPQTIRDFMYSFGSYAAIIFILAIALNTISIFPPITLLFLTSGLAFGKFYGALYLYLGALIGTSCTFFISRKLGRKIAVKLFNSRFCYLDNLVEKKGFFAVLFFRLFPFTMPYVVLNYVSGLTKIKYKDYLLATAIGLIPEAIVTAYFAGTIAEIKSFKDLFTWESILAAVLILVILLLAIFRHKLKNPPENLPIFKNLF